MKSTGSYVGLCCLFVSATMANLIGCGTTGETLIDDSTIGADSGAESESGPGIDNTSDGIGGCDGGEQIGDGESVDDQDPDSGSGGATSDDGGLEGDDDGGGVGGAGGSDIGVGGVGAGGAEVGVGGTGGDSDDGGDSGELGGDLDAGDESVEGNGGTGGDGNPGGSGGTGPGGTGGAGGGSGGSIADSDVGNGGSGGIADGVGSLDHKLLLIVVTPANPLVELDLNTPSNIVFSAKGRYLDGVDEDLSDVVTWSHTNADVGSFVGSNFAINPLSTARAVSTRVTAEYGGKKGAARLTVVSYRKTGLEQDFFFVLPYEDSHGEQQKPLEFGTEPRSMDVFFNMDATGSMGGAIGNLQSGLIGQIVNPIVAEHPGAQFGAGLYRDFPVSPFGVDRGENLDQPFELLAGITSDVPVVKKAVDLLSARGGFDTPESMIESLYQIATGEGLTAPGLTYVAPNNSGLGGVGFRKGAMPIIVTITDAMSHTVGEDSACSSQTNYSACNVKNCADVELYAHSRQQTKDALNAICARSVGVDNSSKWVTGTCDDPRPDLVDFATATGARIPPEAWDIPSRPAGCAPGQCCTLAGGAGRAPDVDGLCPLVFKIPTDGTGLGKAVSAGLQMLTRYATFEVFAETHGSSQSESGLALPAGYTTSDFLKKLIPDSYVLAPPPPAVPAPFVGSTGFSRVTPGTRVSFQVVAYNDIVPQTDQPQFFKAVIRVTAGGCADLDQREVIFLVPPRPLEVPW